MPFKTNRRLHIRQLWGQTFTPRATYTVLLHSLPHHSTYEAFASLWGHAS